MGDTTLCSGTSAPPAARRARPGSFGKTALEATGFQLAEVPAQLTARLPGQQRQHKAGQGDAEAEGQALSKQPRLRPA